jgi:NAD(P)-dependent dehydrogenase (short-subunit alcohol dehydrogenase family)
MNDRSETMDSKDLTAGRLDLGVRGDVAIVMGSGPGIGAATVDLLAAAGARVVAADLDPDVAAGTASGYAGHVIAEAVDVTDRQGVRAFFDRVVNNVGVPATVVNVVGIARPKPLSETTDEDWALMHQLNLHQQFIVAQESLRVLSHPGSYIAVASINGVISSPNNAAYGAAKAGLVSLVRSLGLEMATRGVRVNCVAPGIVETPRLRAFFDRTGRADEFAEAVPMKRMARPVDIAGAVVWLASPLASYVTGQVISVDGGASIKYPLALMG